MKINSSDIFIAFVLVLVQVFLASFEALFIISLILGGIFYKSDFAFWRWLLIEVLVLIVLILINGLNMLSLKQFAEIFSLVSPILLLMISVLVSAITVALAARTSSLILKAFLSQKA